MTDARKIACPFDFGDLPPKLCAQEAQGPVEQEIAESDSEQRGDDPSRAVQEEPPADPIELVSESGIDHPAELIELRFVALWHV